MIILVACAFFVQVPAAFAQYEKYAAEPLNGSQGRVKVWA